MSNSWISFTRDPELSNPWMYFTGELRYQTPGFCLQGSWVAIPLDVIYRGTDLSNLWILFTGVLGCQNLGYYLQGYLSFQILGFHLQGHHLSNPWISFTGVLNCQTFGFIYVDPEFKPMDLIYRGIWVSKLMDFISRVAELSNPWISFTGVLSCQTLGFHSCPELWNPWISFAGVLSCKIHGMAANLMSWMPAWIVIGYCHLPQKDLVWFVKNYDQFHLIVALTVWNVIVHLEKFAGWHADAELVLSHLSLGRNRLFYVWTKIRAVFFIIMLIAKSNIIR